MRLALVVLGALLVAQDGAVDVEHYDPDAQRKVFRTDVEWEVERLEGALDETQFDLLPFLGGELRGQVQWVLSVRDSPRFEDGELVFVMRDYEDVALRADLAEDSYAAGLFPSDRFEVWGGMERERVSFERFRDRPAEGDPDNVDAGGDSGHETGEWNLKLPKESQLKKAGLLGLEPRVDLAAFAPHEDLKVGDSWEVSAEHLEELLFPVGHPATLLAPMGWASVAEVDVPQGGAIDSATGSVKVTLLEPVEGGRLTRMQLKVDSALVLTPQAALAAIGQVYVDGREFRSVPTHSSAEGVHGEVSVQLEGEGELVWNHELQAFESLALPLDFKSAFKLGFEVDLADRTFDIQLDADTSGHLRLMFSR